jgi:hypothetical protein
MLVFDRGTTQLELWLCTASERSVEDEVKNEAVILFDELPFKEEEKAGKGAKWSYERIGEVLRTVKGTKGSSPC